MASLRRNSTLQEDVIQGWRDVKAAFRLTWQRQKKHLFTSWVHVPLGVLTLLVITWGLRLAIDLAPFRFPAPVIAMLLFFFLLLFLDWLSALFPGQQPIDLEKTTADIRGGPKPKRRRRFVDPVMALLAPPCDFCLRNMSVMFTPSFVLIPAREIIPSKEIGLIAAWFAASQVAAFVIPVLLIWALEWARSATMRLFKKKQQADTPFDGSRRASMATISGVEWEKGMSFSGGQKLGPIATGLSGLTANVIAPISHLTIKLDEDGWRQYQATAMEQARQQGVIQPKGSYSDFTPKSDVSSFDHHYHHRRGRPSSAGGRGVRSISAVGIMRLPGRSRSRSPHAGGRRKKSSKESNITSSSIGDGPLSSALGEYRFPPLPSPAHQSSETSQGENESSSVQRPNLVSLQTCPPNMIDILPRIDSNKIVEEEPAADSTRVNSRDPSELDLDGAMRRPSKVEFGPLPTRGSEKSDQSGKESGGSSEDGEKGQIVVRDLAKEPPSSVAKEPSTPDSRQSDEEEEENAVERLASWISDLITPTLYALLFLAGIPAFFVADVALPLFLAINILTFVAAITIVPPKVRRFLHPILSCSIATVFIIWAFAAMKGIGLKNCLNQFYSVDAKYSDLWNPRGYTGAVPGAGDVLFSTLDAGIVALAVPMYRYRKELKENFIRMVVVLTPCAALSLFFWNWIAALMGMDQLRSLAFTARFMSTPLAIELAGNIGADESITVILVVLTGIIAAILKDHFFRMMRVDREDHLIIGITMGSTAGAIGASSLINTPRVMAVASLSFVIFGSILLVATAIPPIVEIVRMLA